MATISIIIPAYNKSSYILDTLESCINQEYSDYEIIIVDDCSQDDTFSKIQLFAAKNNVFHNIIIHKNVKNGGVSYSRNVGIQKAAGEYVLFLDADDILSPDALSLLYQAVRKNNADIVFPQREQFTGTCRFDKVCSEKHLVVQKVYSPPQTITGILINKTLIDQHKLRFQPELKNGEDTLFAAVLFCLTDNMRSISSPLYFYRRDDQNSLSRGQWNNPKIEIPRETNVLRYMEKYYSAGLFLSYAEKAKAIRIIRNKKNALKNLLCQYSTKDVPSELRYRVSPRDILSANMMFKKKLMELAYLLPAMESLFVFKVLLKLKK